MTDAPTLSQLLSLERAGVDVFQGVTPPGAIVGKSLYGGQVIGQALTAAYQTVEDRLCHSLHAYFLRRGDPAVPVTYAVERARDGRSVASRRVTASQNGAQIFNLAASFQAEEEGVSHQVERPEAPAPESLPENEYLKRWPVEMRWVEEPFKAPPPQPPVQRVWFRARAPIVGIADTHAALGYVSDFSLLGAAMRPHGLTWATSVAATIDQSVWIHRRSDLSDWHLFTQESPVSGGGRAFVRGTIHHIGGALIASVAQEGVLRALKPAG
ncbi:MAG: acyl-CoA thioesterase [Hyphomonadaceae bacterium]